MMKLNYFCLFLALYVSLPNALWSSPISARSADCSGSDVYKYAVGQEYVYDYRSNTTLWINDVSNDAVSNVELSAQVVLQPASSCWYQLRLQNVNLKGDSFAQNAKQLADELEKNVVNFQLGQNGALSPLVKFSGAEETWSRNVKRAVLSAFQLRSESELRSANPLDSAASSKSSIVYETDSLGKCRTTYKLKRVDANTVEYEKEKATHRCSLDEYTTSAVQFVPYRNFAEYFQGRLFIDSHKCEVTVKNGLLGESECKHKSTYRISSNGDHGVQAVAKQVLKFNSQRAAGPARPVTLSEPSNIVHEYVAHTHKAKAVDAGKYFDSLCNDVPVSGLSAQHAENYRNLVLALSEKSRDELLGLLSQASKKCKLAAQSALSAIIFSASDASVEALLVLMDKDALSEARLVTEYPVLTALARNANPSKDLLNKLKSYLAGKDAKFPYLKKLLLVFSSLVNTHCGQNKCAESDLESWSSVASANLGSNCADAQNKDLVVSSLKAIGNIGYLKNTNVLEKCAAEKSNNLETRASAIEAFRLFPCRAKENLAGNYAILKDSSDDAEVRIKAFLSLVKCLKSPRFQIFAANEYAELLEAENDLQVVSFIIDYGKEHGVTALLNAVLSNPLLKEKLQTQFKEFSWNRFRHRYSVVRDSALEVETSVVYTRKTFVPRSINFNVTAHALGFSVNGAEVTLRLEGLDEILKAALVDKLSGEALLKRLMENPEKLLPILQGLADKLKYSSEKPYVSLAVRVYGLEVFFSQLDSAEELGQVAAYIRNFRANLYSKKELIRNLFFLNNYNKKPLANGFEFGSGVNGAVSLYHGRDGNKKSGDKVEFKLQVLNSASLSVTRNFFVQVNCDNKLALRKSVNGHLRFKLNADGTRQNDQLTYNANLAPEKEVSLFSLEGKFSKLGANSNYVPVTNFKVNQVQYVGCTSQNFHDNLGLDVCLSVQRPEWRSPRDILHGLESNQFDDDDDDEDEDADRPKITLSGPYNYNLVLKNNDAVKRLTLNAKWSNDASNKNVEASLSSQDSSNVKRRLDITYSRVRQSTSRSYDRRFELLVKGSGTNDERLRVAGNLTYRRKELLDVSFELNNKILRDYHVKFNFNRNKAAEQLAANYNLEALYESHFTQRKFHHLLWKFTTSEKRIDSELHLDSQLQPGVVVRVVEATLSLNPVLDKDVNQQTDVNYDLNFNGRTMSGRNAVLFGKVKFGLLESNLDLTGNYSSPRLTFPTPVTVKAGHSYAVGSESVLHFDVALPFVQVSHGLKVSSLFGESSRVQVELSTPRTKAVDAPYVIYVSNSQQEYELARSRSLSFGFRNFNLDLSQRKSALAQVLVKADNDKVLRSLNFDLSSNLNKVSSRTDVTHQLKKNDHNVVSVHLFEYGSLEELRSADLNELPEQKLGFGVKFNVLEYQGGLSSDLALANSVSKKSRHYSLNVNAENAVRTLLRLSEVNLNSKFNGGNIDFKCKLVREGSQYKSLELLGNGPVRSSADGNEFDVKYTKVFNNNSEKKANGVIRYKLDDLKNFRASLDISNVFNFEANLKNQRPANEVLGTHNAQLSYAYLDNTEPEARKLEFALEKKTLPNNLLAYTLAAKDRLGAPGKLSSNDDLKYLIDLSINQVYANTPAGRQLLSYTDSFQYNSKRYNANVDSKHSFKVDVANNKLLLSSNTNAVLPGSLSKVPQVSLKRQVNAEASSDFSNVQLVSSFETDSKVFGRVFRSLNLNYKHAAKQGAKLLDATLDAQYRLAPSEQVPEQPLKNVNANLVLSGCADAATCLNANVNWKRQLNSVQVADCSGNVKLNRDGGWGEANLKSLLSVELNCDQALVTKTHFSYLRNTDADGEVTRRELEVWSRSDRYQQKKLRLARGPLDENNGNVEVHVYLDNTRTAEYTVEYKRERDLESGRSRLANWKLSAKLGANTKKSCELNIQRNQDYSNSLNCALTLASIPNNQFNYGYKFVAVNRAELLLGGQRNFQLDLLLPVGRQLRLEYQSNRATPIDNTDDDDDPNDEREFNSTVNLYLDYLRDKQAAILINAKRDNYAPGKFRFNFVATNPGNTKTFRVDYNHERLFNKTNLHTAVSYDLGNNVNNRLDVYERFSSDLRDSQFEVEVNLQRPQFNFLYNNRFNKLNGRLHKLNFRIAKLLNFQVQKDHDPNNRRVLLEIHNPNADSYQVDTLYTFNNDKCQVDATISQGGKKLSRVNSVFNQQTVNFHVNVNGLVTNNNYELDVGLLDEKNANGYVKRNNVAVGVANAGFVKVEVGPQLSLNELVVSLKWNRFWHELQEDILGGAKVGSAVSNQKANSYFGDTYAQLAADLRPVIEKLRANRVAVREDLGKSLGLLLKYYESYSDRVTVLLKKLQALQQAKKEEAVTSENLPLHVRLFRRYNQLAERLDARVVSLSQSRFARLAKYVPRLTRVSYNEDLISGFDNNLVLRKKTVRSQNLYQANAEYRERVRRLGALVLRAKSALVRDLKSLSVRGLVNKYKFRSVASGYTIVGSVYNRRHVLGFDGESVPLLSRCSYLLAHDTSKNRFSVLLNYNDKPHVLSVYLYGKGPYNLNANSVSLGDQKLNTPYDLQLDNGKRVQIDRTNDATCIHVNNEIRVCCYEDSNSCSVALSRWYTGKVNGLLGRSDNLPEKLESNQWGLDCKHFTGLLKPPTQDAVRKCYSTFGKHRRALFKDAILTVKSEGWRKVCESVLTNDAKNYCPLLRAYAHHARLESVSVNLPDSCYQCENVANGKQYRVGERVPASEAVEENLVSGSDIVFLSLGCSKDYLLDYGKLAQKARSANKNHNYYLVKVDGSEVSIHQSGDGELKNFNVGAAVNSANKQSQSVPSEAAFEQALFYAGSLFARRVASARHLVILSCGNCLPYKISTVRYFTKHLLAHNVFVTSLGDYNIKLDADSESDASQQVVGYSENELFFYRPNEDVKVDTDVKSSYNFEHEGDVCHRLAVKTHGAVFNLKSLKQPEVFERVAQLFNSVNAQHQFSLGSCAVFRNRKHGAVADFKFNNVHRHEQSADEEEDSLDN